MIHYMLTSINFQDVFFTWIYFMVFFSSEYQYVFFLFVCLIHYVPINNFFSYVWTGLPGLN